jgi:pyruvate dehydrogenase E2 component (dihydrolipoamide acetyltransferase)
VNQLLCIIGQPGLDIDSIVKSIKAPSNAEAPKATAAAPSTVSAAPSAASAPVSAPTATASATVVNEGRIFASPLAKKIAKDKGIDLKYVQGTGEHGRFRKL